MRASQMNAQRNANTERALEESIQQVDLLKEKVERLERQVLEQQRRMEEQASHASQAMQTNIQDEIAKQLAQHLQSFGLAGGTGNHSLVVGSNTSATPEQSKATSVPRLEDQVVVGGDSLALCNRSTSFGIDLLPATSTRVLSTIVPSRLSETKRNKVIAFIREIVKKCLGCDAYLTGSYPTKTHLPDGDIDMTACICYSQEDTWYSILLDALCKSIQVGGGSTTPTTVGSGGEGGGGGGQKSGLVIRNATFVNAEVKVIKCVVDNINVDVSAKQFNALSTVRLIEEFDRAVDDPIARKIRRSRKDGKEEETSIEDHASKGARHGGVGTTKAATATAAATATTATTADAPRHPKDSKLEDRKEVVVATVGEELANIMSEERTIVRQKEVDLTWLMGFMCAKETDLDRKERDFAMHTFQHKSLEYKGAEDDPVTVAFAGIDVDIERTGARKNHGRTKRGGKLTGYTAKYKGDDSQDALASLVASALGTTSRSATEEDVHVDVDVGEGEQEKEKGEEQGNIEREPPQEPPHEQQLQQQHEHEAHVRTVLRAFAIVDNDAVHGSGLCYSQGLNFLVSALLSRCGRDGGPVEGQWGGTTQAACFGMFWWLVRGPSRLIDVYAKHFEGLQHCFTTLNKLMLVHFPRVVDHFNECNVKVSMFATSWFTTLFTNYDTLPRLYVARILDIFIVDGWNFVYQVALAIVSALRLELLGSDFEAILRIVQDPEPIIVAAYTTPEALVQAADQFEME